MWRAGWPGGGYKACSRSGGKEAGRPRACSSKDRSLRSLAPHLARGLRAARRTPPQRELGLGFEIHLTGAGVLYLDRRRRRLCRPHSPAERNRRRPGEMKAKASGPRPGLPRAPRPWLNEAVSGKKAVQREHASKGREPSAAGNSLDL